MPVARSRNMVEALKKAGGSPIYTEVAGAGHDVWTRTYRNSDVFDWLMKNRSTNILLEDAIDLIATHLPGQGVEALSLADARGAVLREEIVVGDAPAGESTPPSLPAGTRLTAAHLAALRWREIHTVQASRPFAWTVASPAGDGPELFAVEQMFASADGLTLKHTPFSSNPDGLPHPAGRGHRRPPPPGFGRSANRLARHSPRAPAHLARFSPHSRGRPLPGGKLWFGHSRSGQTVLCLSGDVTAHLLVTHRLLLPALRHLLKQNEPQPEQVTLNKDVRFSTPWCCSRPHG